MIKKFFKSAGNRLRNALIMGKRKSIDFLPRKMGEVRLMKATQQSDDDGEHAIEKVDDQLELIDQESAFPRQQRVNDENQWSLDQYQVEPAPGKVRFHDIGLPLTVMQAIAELGFQYCTPVQEKSLPDLLHGKDLVGNANTGTGKTAVFLIAIVTRLLLEKKREKKKKVRALILAPTRELVLQIAEEGKQFVKYCHLQITPIYGGVDYNVQMDILKRQSCDIIVATPGRLLDFVGKNVVSLQTTQILVIDEADRMLDMGFIPDVRRIIHRLPGRGERQTLMFSATITDEVKRLASQWCNNPVQVAIEPEKVAVESVEQKVYLLTTAEKYHVLYNLIMKNIGSRIVVFTNQKVEARKLYERLQRNGISCTLLTGDVPQKKRMERLEKFRAADIKVLVATDVAGRGIHIEGITHVVNYTLPYEPEDYVHRIGRTGRAGAEGISISFACEEGGFYLPAIEEFIGQKLECVVPEEDLLVEPPKGSVQKRQNRPYQKNRSRRPAKPGAKITK